MSLIQSSETKAITRLCMDTWMFHVKVIHAWKQDNPQSGDYLDMLLVDKKGVVIHAICKKSYFAHYLEWHDRYGLSMFVTNSILGSFFGGFIQTKHVLKLPFDAYTKIPRSAVQQDVVYIHLDEFTALQCKFKDDRKVEFTFKDIEFVYVSDSKWVILKIELRFRSTAVHIVQYYSPREHFHGLEVDDYYQGYVHLDLTKRSRFSSWFELNKVNDVARMFAFGLPTRFIWERTKNKFYFIARRFSIGRIVLRQVYFFYDM